MPVRWPPPRAVPTRSAKAIDRAANPSSSQAAIEGASAGAGVPGTRADHRIHPAVSPAWVHSRGTPPGSVRPKAMRGSRARSRSWTARCEPGR